MKKILFSILILLLANTTTGFAQLYAHNNTAKNVWLSIVYNYVPPTVQDVSAGDTWVSEGWFFLPPGATIQLTTHLGTNGDYGTKTNFFYYAFQEGGRDWFGARAFLVDTKAAYLKDQLSFRIEKANSKPTYANVPNLQMMPFKLGVLGLHGHHTLELEQSTPNDELVKHDENSKSVFDEILDGKFVGEKYGSSGH